MTPTPPPTHGVILFAHGSRDPLWRLPIEAVATRLRQDHPQVPVTCAYLESCEPNLPLAVDTLLQQTASAHYSIARNDDSARARPPKGFKIRIVPMFLGMGKHAREDLPAIVQDLRGEHPDVLFEVLPTVGEDARVTALLAQIAAAD
jgi:sirohydrochlorin cobaltochelatase